MTNHLNLTAVFWCLVLGLSACSQEDKGGDVGSTGNTAKPRPPHLVELAAVERDILSYRVERTGTLRARREAKIFNQEEGGVLDVPVYEGDAVQAGDVLVRLDDRLLRAQLAKAVAQRRQAEAAVGRLRKLIEKRLISEETLARADTELQVARAEERLLRTRLGYMTITAPFAGRIAGRHVNAGDVAPKHTLLVTLIDPSSLITDVTVSELLLPRLRVGDSAKVRIDALGDTVFSGRILRIYPTVDPRTRRGQIEVMLNPVPEGASAGQFGRVTLITQRQPSLSIPIAGLRRDQRGEYVFRVDKENRAERAAVRSGLRLTDKVEVLAGLEEGQHIVVSGFLGLSEGMRVKDVKARQAPAVGERQQKEAGKSGDT